MVQHSGTRTNQAVEARLRNIQRRLVTARQAVINLREDGEHDLADVMQATIERLNMEEIAWRQWQMEGFRSPALHLIQKAMAAEDERSERTQQTESLQR